MESCGVTWIGVCAVAWNVECCAMWNDSGRVWAVTWDVERCVMWNEAECGPRHVVVEVVLCEMYAASGGM